MIKINFEVNRRSKKIYAIFVINFFFLLHEYKIIDLCVLQIKRQYQHVCTKIAPQEKKFIKIVQKIGSKRVQLKAQEKKAERLQKKFNGKRFMWDGMRSIFRSRLGSNSGIFFKNFEPFLKHKNIFKHKYVEIDQS